MSAENLMLYFNLFFVVIMVFGAIKGFAQGMRKSLFLLVKKIIFWLIFFLTINPVAEQIINTDISSITLNIPGFEDCKNLVEMVSVALETYLEVPHEQISNFESIGYIYALVTIVLKIAYFVIYTIVFRFIYWIIMKIIWAIINPKRMDREVNFIRKEREFRKPKIIKRVDSFDGRNYSDGPRVFGLLFGTVRGFVNVILIVSVLTGILSIIPLKEITSIYREEQSKVEATNSKELSVSQLDQIENVLVQLDEYVKFVEDIPNSPFVKLVKMFGEDENGKTLDLVLFDTMIDAKYEEYNIKMRESLSNILSVGVDTYKLMKDCITSENKIDVNSIDFNLASDIVRRLADINLLVEVIPAVLEIGLSSDLLISNLPIEIDEELASAISSIDWVNDINVLADMVEMLTSIEDITVLINEPTALLKNEYEDFVVGVIEKVSSLTIVSNMLPTIVEYAMEMEEVQQIIGDAEINLSHIVWDEELSQIGEIYSIFLDVSKDISSLIFAESFNLGSITDSLNFNALATLITEVFELALVQELFEPVMNLVMDSIEDESIKEMFNFDYSDPNKWAREFVIVIEIAKDLVRGDNPFRYGLGIDLIKNVRPETIAKSEILTTVVKKAIIDASNNEGLLSSESLGVDVSAYLDVPTSLQDETNPDWDNMWDENGVLVKKGELHKILEALQMVIPSNEKSILNVGDTLDLTAVFAGNPTSDVVSWVSAASSIATVDSTGVVTAIAPGATVIMASNGLITDAYTIIVKGSEYVETTNVFFSESEVTISIGEYFQLNAFTNLDATNRKVEYELVDIESDVISIDEYGLVKALKEGTASVYARSVDNPDVYSTCLVTVVAEPLVKVETNRDFIIGYVDDSIYLETKVYNSEISPTYKIVDEYGVETDCVSIDENGFVTLNNVGSYNIEIYLEETLYKSLQVLTVGEGEATGIKIQPENADISVESLLDGINENTVDTILDSEVLSRSLSKILLTTLESDDFKETLTIHLPSSIMSKDGEKDYIQKAELERLLKSALTIDITTFLSGNDLDLNTILSSLSQDDIDLMMSSRILNSVITKYLKQELAESSSSLLVIPNSAYEKENDVYYKDNSVEVKFLKSSEVKILVKTIQLLNLDLNALINGEDLDIQYILDKLIEGEEGSTLLDALLDEESGSTILHSTLSKVIKEFAIDPNATDEENQDKMLVLPVEALDSNNDVSRKELKNLINLVARLKIDFNNLETSMDVDAILNKLTANEKELLNRAFDAQKGSTVLHATISKFIKDMEGTIVVPSTALDDKDYVSKKELINLVTLVDDLDIDFDSLSEGMSYGDIIDKLNANDGALIDKAFNEELGSEILHATLSKILLDLDNEEVLTIPESVKNYYALDDIHVVSKNEITKLLKSVAEADIDFDNLESSFGSVVDTILNMSDESLGKIFDSHIIRATLTSYLPLTLPIDAADVEGYITKEELISVLNVVTDVLELKTLDITFDASLLDVITKENKEEKLTGLFSSKVIWNEVSKILSEIGDPIVVPSTVYVTYAVDDENNHLTRISVDELKALISGVLDLDFMSYITGETTELEINISLINDKVDSLLESDILLATVSKVVSDAFSGLPFDAKEELGDCEVLKEKEIKAIFLALDNLGIDDYENIKIDDISMLLEESSEIGKTKLDLVLDSVLIWDKLSSIISEVDEIEVPSDAYQTLYNPVNSDDKVERISKEEIRAVVKALQVLEVTDINEGIDVNGTIATINDNYYDNGYDTGIKKIDYVLESIILWDMLSGVVENMEDPTDSTNPIAIPTMAYTDINLDENIVKEDDRISKVEIKALLNGADKLGAMDYIVGKVNDLTINIHEVSENNALIKDSYILRATVSNVIDSTFEGGIPFDAKEELGGCEVLKEEEIEYLFKGLDVLGITDPNNVNITSVKTLLGESGFGNQTNIEVALESVMIWQEVTRKLRYIVDVPTEEIETFENPNDPTDVKERVSKDEILAVITTLDILGLDLNESVEFDADIVSSLCDEYIVDGMPQGTKIEKILESTIMWEEMSKVIKELDDPIIKPYTIYENENEANRVTKDAIINLLKGCDALELMDYIADPENEELTINVSLLNDNIAAINASDIMRASVANIIKTGFGELTADSVTTLGGKEVLTELELINIFKGLEALGVTDPENVNITNIALLLEVSNEYGMTNLEVALESNMIWNEVSEKMNSVIDVPSDAKEIEYGRVTKEEIFAAMNALSILGVTDMEANIEFDADMISSLNDEYEIDGVGQGITKATLILDSKIMWEQISNTIEELPSPIVRPLNVYVDLNGNGVISKEDDRISKEEIMLLLDGAEALGLMNYVSGSVTTFVVSINDLNSNVDLINESNILRASIAKVISQKINPLPNDALSETFKDDTYADETYLRKDDYHDELKALVQALVDLDIQTTENIEIPTNVIDTLLDINPSSGNVRLDEVLESIIVWNEFSKTLENVSALQTDAGHIVLDAYEADTGRISIDEIKAIFKALKALGITDMENANVATTGFDTLSETYDGKAKYKWLLDSNILWDKVSCMITSIEALNTEIHGAEAGIAHDAVTEVYPGHNRITKEEIDAIMMSMKVLDIHNLEPEEVQDHLNDEYIISLVKPYDINHTGLDYILQSNILWDKISSTIMACEELKTEGFAPNNTVPTDALVDVDANTKRIDKNEIYYLLKALEAMQVKEIGYGDLTNVGIFELLKPYEGKMEIEYVLDSVLLWNRISRLFIDTASTNNLITIPAGSYLDGGAYDTIETERIAKSEIINFVVAMNAVGIDNVALTQFDNNIIYNSSDDELVVLSIDLVKSNIMLASIPGIFESAIGESYRENGTTVSFIDPLTGNPYDLKGELNEAQNGYIQEGELIKLMRGMKAANYLKDKELSDLKGKALVEGTATNEIYKRFVIMNDSAIISPTIAQVLSAVIGVPVTGTFTNEQIASALDFAALSNGM